MKQSHINADAKHLRHFLDPDRFIFRTGTHRKSKTTLTIFSPRNYWDVLITLFQKEDLTAKETDQALELSWIKE